MHLSLLSTHHYFLPSVITLLFPLFFPTFPPCNRHTPSLPFLFRFSPFPVSEFPVPVPLPLLVPSFPPLPFLYFFLFLSFCSLKNLSFQYPHTLYCGHHRHPHLYHRLLHSCHLSYLRSPVQLLFKFFKHLLFIVVRIFFRQFLTPSRAHSHLSFPPGFPTLIFSLFLFPVSCRICPESLFHIHLRPPILYLGITLSSIRNAHNSPTVPQPPPLG